MSSEITTDKQTIRAIAEEVAKIVSCHLVAAGAATRWIPRKAYAGYWGLSVQTISNRTPFLRKMNAVSGTGKAIRYDKFCDTNTGERTIIPDGTKAIR